MDSATIFILVMGIIIFGFIGAFIGAYIAQKTKLIEKFSKNSRERNKILNDPKLIEEKIEKTAKELNPDAVGKLSIIDMGDKMSLDKEKKEYTKTPIPIPKEVPKEKEKEVPEKKNEDPNINLHTQSVPIEKEFFEANLITPAIPKRPLHIDSKIQPKIKEKNKNPKHLRNKKKKKNHHRKHKGQSYRERSSNEDIFQ